MPSLSQILAWDVTHLQQAACSWATTAEHWEDAFTSVHQGTLSPGGTAWEGEAAEAAQQRTFADLVRARGLADILHEAASVARRGADRLTYAKSSALSAIQDAEEAGFTVGEDLSVTSRERGGSAAVQAARQLQARELAAEIHRRVTALSALDHDIAATITTTTAPLSGVGFDEPSDDTMRAVDYHTVKQSPPPPDPNTDEPWKDLPSPRTAQDVRDALKELRRGVNRPHRELDTLQQIQDFYDWLTKNAVGDFPGAGFPRKVLEDGTEIKLRPDSTSGGPTIEAVLPGVGKNPKVHLPFSPFIDEPPQLPPITDPAPAPVPPPQVVHPPATLPPSGIFEPNGLPPWLQNPSPPGIAVPSGPSPVTIMPGVAVSSVPAPSPSNPGGSLLPPEFGHDLAEVGKDAGKGLLAGVAIIGGLILSGVTSSGQIAR